MNAFLYLITNGLAVYISSLILPGIHVTDFFVAIVVAVVLGLANMLLKPIFLILTLPLTILTLGLFTFIVNGVMVLVADSIVPGFTVDSIWWGILFSVVLSLIGSFFNSLKSNRSFN